MARFAKSLQGPFGPAAKHSQKHKNRPEIGRFSHFNPSAEMHPFSPFSASKAPEKWLCTAVCRKKQLFAGSFGSRSHSFCSFTDGKVYAISTGTNAPALLYRQDILDELGLSLPMNPTMSEYAEVSKAVYEATGLRDTFITDSSAVIFRQHLRNYGLNLYNEDATALGFDDPKYLVNMWNLALQAQEEGWGLLPGEATATTAFDSMVTDAWSRLQNSNELQAYREATGKDIRMVMIPSLDDATTPASFLKPAMFWCVSADSDVKDAAVRFINFFTNSPECYDIVGIERAVPISSKMREYVAPSLDEVSQEVVEYVDYVSQPEMSSPLMNPDPPEHTKVSELLDQYSEQVRYGEITDLETAAQQFMDEANAILAAE